MGFRGAQTLVARSVAGVKSRHRRRRSMSTDTVEQKLGHDPPSGSWNEPNYRRQATRGRSAPDRRAIPSDTEQRSTLVHDECRPCLQAAVLDDGPNEPSRCPDSRIAQARALRAHHAAAEARAYTDAALGRA
jgi:hypothetical protein